MKKIQKLKLNILSESTLKDREMNYLHGGGCVCMCEPGSNENDYATNSSQTGGSCSCGCGCDPMIYYQLSELPAAAESIGHGY